MRRDMTEGSESPGVIMGHNTDYGTLAEVGELRRVRTSRLSRPSHLGLLTHRFGVHRGSATSAQAETSHTVCMGLTIIHVIDITVSLVPTCIPLNHPLSEDRESLKRWVNSVGGLARPTASGPDCIAASTSRECFEVPTPPHLGCFGTPRPINSPLLVAPCCMASMNGLGST